MQLILIFLSIILSEYRLFKCVTFNDNTIIFSYVNDGYLSIRLRQLIWIYKDQTYNGRNGMGEDLQLGKVCNGFSVPFHIFRAEGLQWAECLQYNTGTFYMWYYKCNRELKSFNVLLCTSQDKICQCLETTDISAYTELAARECDIKRTQELHGGTRNAMNIYIDDNGSYIYMLLKQDNHTMSSKSNPSANGNKVITASNEEGVTNHTETSYNFDKVWSGEVNFQCVFTFLNYHLYLINMTLLFCPFVQKHLFHRCFWGWAPSLLCFWKLWRTTTTHCWL